MTSGKLAVVSRTNSEKQDSEKVEKEAYPSPIPDIRDLTYLRRDGSLRRSKRERRL